MGLLGLSSSDGNCRLLFKIFALSFLKKLNIGIIITDHNVKEALSIVDFGYIIYNGEIIKSGSPKEITSDKFVKKIYLGDNYQ